MDHLLTAFCELRQVKQSSSNMGKGVVELGNIFRMNETSDVRSLFPLDITETTGFQIANQVYESLVKFDQKTLQVVPALAKSWESNVLAG
jgi:ABC-type transport system substrate-binding protein